MQPAEDDDEQAQGSDFEALAGSCGYERWKVKTLSDPDAHYLHRQRSRPMTVEELVALGPPPWSAVNPRHEMERVVVSVEACVIEYASQADSDLHVVIRGDGRKRMIAEFPHAGRCARHSFAPGLIERARQRFLSMLPAPPGRQFLKLKPPLRVRLEGPIFFDRVHGQAGVARNGVEIHPVLRVENLGSCTEVKPRQRAH